WQFHPRGTHRVGLLCIDFFGSFLYQDKKERENRSLQNLSVAMQRFSVALRYMHSVHRFRV
ncbi:MAG TPA: hypothetical protein PLW22_10895, partial [Tenuifilum sp.]|uniref:hypothetical protein n=1 Tax=Tenuifilum sp. TaxID=2760880 RepID=UPI002CF32DBF|nr:hypothetical protein [Tenuifilum sp.]